MAIPAYFWPLSGAAARGVVSAPFGAGLVVADWTTPALWPFNGFAFTAPLVLAGGTSGFSDLAPDAATGVWAISYDGVLWHQPAAGAATSTVLPSGSVYLGCASAGGQTYVMTSFGAVLTSGGALLANWPVAARALTASGTTLISLLSTVGVGSMTTAGVTGSIAFPGGITAGSCLTAVSGLPLAIAGWQVAPALSGAIAAALSPTDATVMLAAASGRVILWRASAGLSDGWSQTQTVAGLANLTALAWTPDGFHALACSPVSGVVQVFNYATGVVSLAQTVTVSGALSVAVCPGSSLNALVAQSGQSQAMSLVNTGTWAAGAAVTGLPGITALIPYGASGAVAAYASGLAYLTLVAPNWAITNRLLLSYAPSVITQDPLGNVYAAGSGVLSVVSPSGVAVVGSGAWAGAAPSGIGIQQGRLLLAVPSDGFLYDVGQTAPGAWTVQTGYPLTPGLAVGLGQSNTTLFVMGATGTTTLGFSGSPFTLTAPVAGMAAQRIAGAWVTTPLGVGHSPMALCYSGSNLYVATSQNELFTINQSGTILSSGIVPQYATQPQSVPLGISSMLAATSGVFAATSLSGTLIQVA